LVFLTVGILTASLFLRSGWGKLSLIVATIPIAICKNAVRIVALSLLSVYVDHSFLNGPIHHRYGGLLSLPVDFLLFVPLLLALRKYENTAVLPDSVVRQTEEFPSSDVATSHSL
jgi:exosortase/archaeosortase family protein